MKDTVKLVAAALQGEVPPEAAWTATLDLANRGWVTPDVFVSLRDADRLGDVPPPVHEYLAFIHGRNLERNARLRTQLIGSIRALNGAGIEPVLLKGAIHLFTADEAALGRRMISDLDLSIPPQEHELARRALATIGYAPTHRSNEVGRAEDAGTIELHGRANGRSLPYLAGDLRSVCEAARRDEARAWVPPATARALHLTVHDMLKDGDYWRYSLDLRHLWDLAQLARSPGIDWDELRAVLNDKAAARSLDLQAVALSELFGVEVPQSLRTRRALRQHALRLHVADGGIAASSIRALGRLSWGLHRFMATGEARRTRSLRAAVWHVVTAGPKGSRL